MSIRGDSADIQAQGRGQAHSRTFDLKAEVMVTGHGRGRVETPAPAGAICTLSSAAPAFNVPPDAVTSLTKLMVLLVVAATKVSVCVVQPMLLKLLPVVSNVKLVVTPLIVTANGLTTGGAP